MSSYEILNLFLLKRHVNKLTQELPLACDKKTKKEGEKISKRFKITQRPSFISKTSYINTNEATR